MTEPRDEYSPDRMRWEHDWQAAKDRERQRATQPRQEPLPFGDGYLDDDELVVEIHGTRLGVARHERAGEPLCAVCLTWVEELIADGYAVRREENT